MSGMDRVCPDPSRLAAWVEKTLEPAERSALGAHLADCDECRRSVALTATLAPAPEGRVPVDPALLARVLRAGRPARFWPLAAAAALALVAVLAGLLRPSPKDPPAPTATATATPAPAPAPEPPRTVVAVPAHVDIPPRPPAVKPAPSPDEGFLPARPLPEKAPKTADPAPVAEAPRPVPARIAPPATTTDFAKIFGSLFVFEPAGELLVRRERGEPALLQGAERVGWQDALETRSGAGFNVDGRASVALEKDAEAGLTVFTPDAAYRLSLAKSAAWIDTEGSVQHWQVLHGPSRVDLKAFNGRAVVEPRGDSLAVQLLEGRVDVVSGGAVRHGQVGREVVLSREGSLSEQKAETQKRLARFLELRPRGGTAFAASFDEPRDEVKPFPYALVSGRLGGGPGAWYLMAERVPVPVRPAERGPLTAALRPDRGFSVTGGMVLRFRYRTNLSKLVLGLGRYESELLPRSKPGVWTDAEVPVAGFSFEGTPLLPTDAVEEIRFSSAGAAPGGQLDVDGVHFLRRAR
jgi:hypothetical protein